MHLLYLYYLLQVSCRLAAEREAAALLRTIAAWRLLLPILRERAREREREREREERGRDSKNPKNDETVSSELLTYAQRGGGSRSGGGASERVTERVSERQARLGPGGSGGGRAKETGGVDPQTSLPGAASSRKMMS
jgi:hypothetical protein